VKVLLDENLPHKLRELLAEHETFTVAYMGWVGIRNGELLAASEREGFDVLITSDQGFPHQQNMTDRKLAVLLVPTPDWNIVKNHSSAILLAIETSSPGTFSRVSFSTSSFAKAPYPQPS
jgi:predicted nuclease of predicted toxin-antitoxin system